MRKTWTEFLEKVSQETRKFSLKANSTGGFLTSLNLALRPQVNFITYSDLSPSPLKSLIMRCA